MFTAVRNFFDKRGVLEVDVPVMGKGAPIDLHIDIMSIPLQGGERGFLHSSVEYAMKRLIALGAGDIYQMSHVFRDGEVGHLHNPEFTMVEWYRIGMTFPQLIDETVDFVRLFIGDVPLHTHTYRSAIKEFVGVDYVTASHQELIDAAHRHGTHLPQDAIRWDLDTLLSFMMGFIVEPHLQNLTVIRDFPASQSALAQTSLRDGALVAERFEIYFRGTELANGFHELTDPIEQRRRFHASNAQREQAGKSSLPLDEQFLNALERGLPDCCGVAVGFDRLMLLRHNKKSLEDVLPFSWKMI